jgi:hypothetical protein
MKETMKGFMVVKKEQGSDKWVDVSKHNKYNPALGSATGLLHNSFDKKVRVRIIKGNGNRLSVVYEDDSEKYTRRLRARLDDTFAVLMPS